MALADHTHPEAATKADISDRFGDLRREFRGLRTEFAGLRTEFAGLRTEFGNLKAEVAELRGRVDLLTWVVGIGFTALIATSAVFRYVG